MNRAIRCALLASWAMAVLACASAPVASMPKGEPLSDKESFMLMFGKGNGAMRVLCALQKQGVIDAATRRRWIEQLDTLLNGPGDSASDQRHTRIGMAFADARSSLCPERLMPRNTP